MKEKLGAGRCLAARVVVGAVVLFSVLAGSAHAYVTGGQRWPTHTITYFDAGPNPAAVRAAVLAWNTSGANVRFVATSRSQARVVVVPMNPPACYGVTGYATLGYDPSGDVVHLRACPDVVSDTIVAAHEFGHILGLNHEFHVCATMNPVTQSNCGSPPAYSIGCRILELDDVQGAISLYGGHVRPITKPQFCPEYSAPKPPASLSVAGAAPPAQAVKLQFRVHRERRLIVVPSPHIKGLKVPAQSAPTQEARIYGYAGSCPTGKPKKQPTSVVELSKPGLIHVQVDDRASTPRGPRCYAVYITDSANRHARRATIAATIEHQGPQAGFDAPSPVTASETADFTDTSTPGDAQIVSWTWSFGDGSPSSDIPEHTYAHPGVYTVTLTVKSSDGMQSQAAHQVTVTLPPGPAAEFEWSPAPAGQDTSFVDESNQGDFPITSWSWSFGDGGRSTDEYPDHTYAKAGTYTVTLTVTSQDSQQSTVSHRVTIPPDTG